MPSAAVLFAGVSGLLVMPRLLLGWLRLPFGISRRICFTMTLETGMRVFGMTRPSG